MISNFFRLVHNDVPYELFQRQPENYEKPRPKYYDRVYLCVEDLRPTGEPNTSHPIKGFLCKTFDDFEFADEHFQRLPNKDKIRSAIIPMCKWSPQIFDPIFLSIRLKKIFWIGKHLHVRSDGNRR